MLKINIKKEKRKGKGNDNIFLDYIFLIINELRYIKLIIFMDFK